MNVQVTVIGDGVVTGAGTHSMGDEVTLTASTSSFSYFLRGEEVIVANPYVFEAPDSDVVISAVFIVTLEAYLKASVGYLLPDAALMKIRVDRGLAIGLDVSTLSTQTRELAFADALMYGVNSPSQVQGAKDSDNGWSHQEASGTLSITDKRLIRTQANAIYKKYGEATMPSIIFTSLNGVKSDAQARY